MVAIKEKCNQTKECAALLDKFNACNDRVAGKSQTTETCVEEQTDFLHCVDHCVSLIIIEKIKNSNQSIDNRFVL